MLLLIPEYFYTSIRTFTNIRNVNSFATPTTEGAAARSHISTVLPRPAV